MTGRLLLTSKGEKTVCADRDDRGGVLLTGRDEQQVYLTAEMLDLLDGWMLEQRLRSIPMPSPAKSTNEVAA